MFEDEDTVLWQCWFKTNKIIIMLHDVLLCFFTTCLTHGDLEIVLSSIIYISYLKLSAGF